MRNVVLPIKTCDWAGQERAPRWGIAAGTTARAGSHDSNDGESEGKRCQRTCSSQPRAGRPSGQAGRASVLLGSPAAQGEFLQSESAISESPHQASRFSLGQRAASPTTQPKETIQIQPAKHFPSFICRSAFVLAWVKIHTHVRGSVCVGASRILSTYSQTYYNLHL